jgi:hypothetical protein
LWLHDQDQGHDLYYGNTFKPADHTVIIRYQRGRLITLRALDR